MSFHIGSTNSSIDVEQLFIKKNDQIKLNFLGTILEHLNYKKLTNKKGYTRRTRTFVYLFKIYSNSKKKFR